VDASPLGEGPWARLRSPLLQTLEDPLRLLQSPLTQLSILGITMGLMTLRYATFFTRHPIVFLATSACVGLLALAHAVGGRNSVIASYALCVALLAQPAAFHFYANNKTPEQLAAGPVVNGQMLFGLPLFVSVGVLLGAQQHLSSTTKLLVASVFEALRLCALHTIVDRTNELSALKLLFDVDLPFITALLLVLTLTPTSPQCK